MIDYQYATDKPRSYWKVRVTADNLQEVATMLADLDSSNASVVNNGIEWSWGIMPTRYYRAAVGDWVYTSQIPPTQNITQVGASTDEPLTTGYQALPADKASYTITAD